MRNILGNLLVVSENRSLAGKTALITGGGRRIGRATALALADASVNTVVHYHTSKREAEETAEAARAKGVRAWCVDADLAETSAAEGLFPRAVEIAGPINFLVNSASIFPEDTLESLTAQQFLQNMQVNALAPLLIARCFAAQGRPGAMVNFLDARMLDYDRRHVSYHLSKRTLFALTRLMALEYAPAIRVNAVAPGAVLPPEGKDESYLQSLARANPLNQIGSLDGITDAVLFLLRGDFITGQVIYVDGGRHIKANVYG